MIRIWIDDDNVVRLDASGRLDPADVLRAHERFYEEHWEAYVAADLHLADYRGADLSGIAGEHIRTLAEGIIDVAQRRPPLRIAVLMDPGVGFGFGRMWQQFASPTGWDQRVFTDEEEAWRWLREGDGADEDGSPGPRG